MKYLVDTSVLIHSLLSKPKLNQKALSVLSDDSVDLYLSVVTPWEIAIKVAVGKLILPERPAEFVARAMRLLSLRPLDITHFHASGLDGMPHHHRDPFDRMLIAQAQAEGMTLLTADRIFARYKVEHIFCGL